MIKEKKTHTKFSFKLQCGQQKCSYFKGVRHGMIYFFCLTNMKNEDEDEFIMRNCYRK